ncbi:hypothetical protein FSP39_021839 [Pinctada imbricata]|uniref:SAM pointed domain-containing Ets transcription factor n=1 Tax=Pinctada imbricata TaxID=66713 RepID=A0AA88YF39_PINIB|nr:hypothetical protein FSP39_021839 [Pinctada imbricata]
MFSAPATSMSQLPLTVTEFIDIGDLAPLGPNIMSNVTDVREITQNCTSAKSVTDQRLLGSESPKSFLDLDTVNEQDISLYDHTVNIKEEKMYVNCVSEQLSPTFQYPYDYSLLQTDNYQPPSSPEEYHDIKTEHPEPDLSETIVRALKREINEVCKTLEIQQDPMSWSVEDARKWLMWHLGHDYQTSQGVLEQFNFKGSELCALTADEFQMKSLELGKNLHAQLDVWKNACKLCGPVIQQTTQTYDPCQMFNVINESYTVWPNPSVSPTPSISSDDSSSSNNMYSSSDDERLSIYSHLANSQITPHQRRSSESHQKQTIHLWEFLKELLLQPENYSNCIKWIDRERGVFKIEDSSRVARLWGRRKNRPAMNYDKLSRSIRQYYKKNIIRKTENSKRLVYQFCVPYL